MVYTYSGIASAFNAATGAKLWSISLSMDVIPTPGIAVANGVVYTGSYDDSRHARLYAVSATTGARLESIDVGSVMAYAPTVANGTVYIVSYNGLHAFSLPGTNV